MPAEPTGPSILDTMDDLELFGELFKGTSWDAWRAFLASLFALPMSAQQLAIYQRQTGRTTPPAQPFREAALVIGRRGGKSRVLALIACYLACFRDYHQFIVPGEIPIVAVVAADRVQARVILSYVRGLLQHVDLLAELITGDEVESITLSNGVRIEISTGNIGSPRGRTFIAVLADEIAFWRTDDSSRRPDIEVLNSVRPGLASIPGSMLLMASSPYARRGALWGIYRRHYGQDTARTLVWQADTLTMNPALDRSVVDDAFDDDEISAAAEYGAQFRTDVETFVSREVIDRCTVTHRTELLPAPSTGYVAFTDPSGGSSDSFTLAIGHRDHDMGVLDCVREIKPPFSPESTIKQFAELLQRYGISKVEGDRFGGEFPREHFRNHGITYTLAERPKSAIYTEFLPLMNSGKIELLDLPRLQNQLIGLERRTTRAGRDSVDHAPGQHDDVCNAVAGVMVLVAGKPDWRTVWSKL